MKKMTKAPKRYGYQDGGGVKKTVEQLAAEAEAKKIAQKTGVKVPNPTYPTQDEQMYAKGMISETELKRRQSPAYQAKGSGSFITGKKTYGLQDPLVLKGYKEGGEVKKMKIAPRRFKK